MVRRVPPAVRAGAVVFVLATLVFLLAPLAVVAGASVSESRFLGFPPSGFSLQWYAEIFETTTYVGPILTSLQLGAVVTLAASVLGTAAAITIHRGRLPGGNLVAALFLSPLVLPTIIFAIGLLMVWSTYADGPSFTALWLGHTMITLPYVIRTVLAVLHDSDPFLEEAAQTMGASAWQRLWYVVLPQCTPGLAAGAFFAFNISFDEAVIALFLRQPGLTTLPIQIYSELEFSPDPSVAAVSTLMIAITIAIIALVERLFGVKRLMGS